MRRTIIWRACLLAAVAVLTPGVTYAQGVAYAPPDFNVPLPLYSTHPEQGGLFLFGEFVIFQQTNPMREQLVAVRGFVDVDGSVTNRGAGAFVGSGAPALDVDQLKGPGTWQPGFKIGGGWKFEDGSALTFDFMYLTSAQYLAAATSAAPSLQERGNLSDSFITAFVYNFPNQYAGPARKTGINSGNDYAVYGIWNGASIMTEAFLQRTEQYEMTYRMPAYETETYRFSGLMGPRVFWIWERFQWRTTSLNDGGQADATDVAVYNNIVSNRLWGAFIGCDQEWYLGHGFAAELETNVALFADIVKEEAGYALGVKYAGGAIKRTQHNYTMVPELEGKLNLVWYPIEGVQLKVGYNIMAFFNTIASQTPVSLDYGAIDPPYSHEFRLFNGLEAGVGIVF